MPPALPSQRTSHFSRGDLYFLGLLAAVGLMVGLRGILHLGYVGQDFPNNRALMLLFPYKPLGFYYAWTNPPGLYWLANLVRGRVSVAHDMEVVALAFLLLNAAGLWVIYGLIWEGVARWQLRYSAAALITMVPFRVIHSVVFAADALTLPIFAVAALFTFRLFRDPANLLSWAGLSICLLAGMFCKYTFVGMLPPTVLLLAWAIVTRLGKAARLRWCLVGAAALAIPAAAFLLQLRESASLAGTMTDLVWLPRGASPVMRWSDILVPKKSDVHLLSAPEYYRDRIYEVGRYSYPGLLHVAVFTDCMGVFQPPPAGLVSQLATLTMKPANRDRSALSQALQAWSARWCLVYSALAVAGTLLCGVLAVASLVLRRPLIADATIVAGALALGFYAPVFLSLTRLTDPYAGGFWLPRLVLPAILVFLILGFVMLDLACERLGRLRPGLKALLAAFAGYTLVACLLFVGFLS
jgi:hypothetical protein